MFKRILVPLDGSAASERVLPLAARLAPDSAWTFLHVIDVSLGGDMDLAQFADQIGGDARDQLAAAVTRYAPTHGRISSQLDLGAPASEILRRARPEAFDLIAMTTHGRSGIDRWMLGSVAEKVLRGAEVPVLVTRHETDGDTPLRSVAIALDGLPFSEQALPVAEKIAVERDLELHFIHVVEPLPYPKDTRIGRIVLDRLARFQERVRGLGGELKQRGVKVRFCVTTGNPAARIVDYCRQTPIDLLVMATHGRGGIGRWFLGSVTEKVLRASETPMLVVRCGSPAH